MNLYKIKLVSITLILFIAGCIRKEKDELTLPVRTHLDIGLIEPSYVPGSIEWMDFTARIGIQKLVFEGKREKGEDIYFETDPEMDLPVIGLSPNPERICYFDLPHGVYNYMKWDVILKRIPPNIWSDYFLDSLNIGLVITGMYDYGYGEDSPPPKPVILAIDDTVKLSFRTNENAKIVIGENNYYRIKLLVDISSAFSLIKRDSIQKLEPTGSPWDQIILISSNKNEQVYSTLVNLIFLWVI